MAISEKYGKLDIPRISSDEPMFILRSQDKLAGPTIEMYRLLAASHGSKVVGALQKEIDSFRQWKSNKKLPD